MTSELPTREIDIFRPDVPEHVLKAVTSTYPDIGYTDEGTLEVRANVPQEVIEDDLNFWLDNPNIPAENVCSRLGNYQPTNQTQVNLLHAASYLVNEGSTQRAMGLIAHGDPGLGKTHIAVGLAKEISARAQRGSVTYINAATQTNLPYKREPYLKMADDGKGTIILDDVNSPYGMGADALRHAVSAIHDVGGRLFVTSNATDLNAFLNKALRSSADADGIEFSRLQDRVRGLLLPVHLEGESHRIVTSQNPWLGFIAMQAPVTEESPRE